MVDYKHGISTNRDADISADAQQAARVQVAIGTAPVNLLDKPSDAVNVPVFSSRIFRRRAGRGRCGLCGGI